MLIIESSNHLSSLCAGKSFLGYWNGLKKKFALGSHSNLDKLIANSSNLDRINKIINPTFRFKFQKIKNIIEGDIILNFIDIDPMRNFKYKRVLKIAMILKKL